MAEEEASYTGWRRWALLGFLLIAAVYLVHSSSIKSIGHFPWDYDVRYPYTAGACWWAGESPYDAEIFTETWEDLYGAPPRFKSTFVYPPTMAIIGMPLALLPPFVASWTFRVFNFLALGLIVWFTWRLMSGERIRHRFIGPAAWYVGLTFFLTSVVLCIFQGQNALVIAAGCLAAWYGVERRILWLLILGFLVASAKPQISMVPLLYILFLGHYRWFLYGASASAALALLMIAIAPDPGILEAYRGSFEKHLTHQYFNQWNWYCSVPALLGSTAWGKFFTLAGVALGVAATAWIAWRQRRGPTSLIQKIRHQQLVWIVAMSMLPVHFYDLTGQVFVVLTLWVLPDWRRRALVFLVMFVGDKSYSIASKLERLGESFEGISKLLWAQGGSAMALVLMFLFFYWYWRDQELLRAPEDVPAEE